MKAISKKLLSLLVVIAMVLSMVPFGGLSIFAVETKAAVEDEIATVGDEIEYGSANLTTEQAAEVQRGQDVQTAAKAIEIPEEGTTFEAECPVCKAPVTWTKKTGALHTLSADGTYHYVWQDTVNVGTAYNWLSTGGKTATVCILMKDAVLAGGGTIMAGTNGTINLMGTGTLTSDGSNSDSTGLLKVSSGNAKLNLYGGTYIYTGSSVTYPNLKVGTATAEANIYADAVIGKATEDTSAVSYNVLVTAGNLNMYGGTIQNGISGDANYSGNVTVNGDNASFNMYGGSISGGSRAASATSAATAGHAVRINNSGIFNMYGGTITGGKSWNGGQGGAVYTQAKWTSDESYIEKAVLNLQGGTITGGQSDSNGGNVSGYRGVVNIGGTVLIKDGVPKSTSHSGANIYIPNAPLVVNITGGKIEGGNGKTGGSIFNNATTNAYAQLNISGGIITGGKATDGGNIYVAAGAPISITGGTIQNGTATGNGGNIYFADSATISGGTIQNGTAATNGGNIYLTAATLTIKDGTIIGGESQNSHGGNITATNGAHLTVSGGVIANGNCGIYQGGNIHVWNSRLDISGGYIYGGTNTSGTLANENIWVQGNATGGTMDTPMPVLNISGGNINGDCRVSGTITLSGNPVITRELTVPDGDSTKVVESADGGFTITYPTTDGYNPTTVNVDNLTAGENGAKIEIWNAQSTLAAITVASDNAQALIDGGNIVADRSGYRAICTDNVIYLEEYEAEPEVGVFAPESFDGKAYCPVCGTLETWKERTASTSQDSQGHWYLADDVTTDKDQTIYVNNNGTKIGCLNLNGHTLSMTGRIGMTIAGTTLNIMDTSADKSGVITSSSSRSDSAYNDGTIVIQKGATVNLHGGTFRNSNSSADVVHMKSDADAMLNIYQGAVIDGGARYGVNVVKGMATLDGGTIQGASGNTAVVKVASGTTFTVNSGTIDGKNVTRAVETAGTVTMNGGTIQNGNSATTMGGNIYVQGGSFTMNDGFIKDGKAMNYGGNIAINAAVTVTVKDGEISGGTITGTAENCGGGNIAVRTTGATLDIQGGEIKDGTVNFDISSHAGGNIHMGGGTVKISGGTISGGKSASSTAGGSIYMTGGSLLQMTAGTITGGENTNTGGGNIGVWNGTVEIGGTAQVLDGIAKSAGGNIYICKNTSADNKLTITGGEISGGDAITNGGNIFIGATEELEMTGGTVSSGTAAQSSSNYGGGNIYSDGKVTMSGGEIHSGTAVKGPGGNVVIANADMEMSGDAKIYDGTAEDHQGGNVRVYKGELKMGGSAGIYGGHSGNSSKSHNVWVVAGDMEMSGNSYVYGKDQTNGNAIAIAPYGGTSSTLTLKGNAKVMNDPTDPVVSKGSINLGYTACNDDDLTNDMHANIVIGDGWSGEAYIMMFKSTGALNDASTATKMAWFAIGDTVDGGAGSVNGPVGTGTAFTGNLYYTARDYYTGIVGSAESKLVLAAHAVVDTEAETEQWMSLAEALAAADGSETKYLKAVDDVTLSDETVYIDALKDIKVTGTGTVKGIDPDNKDYKTSTGKINAIDVTLEPEATIDGTRYINVDGTFHAIEMRLTNVTLRANEKCGLYYKASFKCDSTLAAAIDAYGVALDLDAVPDENFWQSNTFTVNENFKDMYDSSEIANTVNTNSGGVWNIMKTDLEDAENQERLVRHIYANAYILLKGSDTPIMADTENAGTTDGVGYSLYEVMAAVDDKVDTLTNENQVKAVASFYKTWSSVWSNSFTVDGVVYNPVADFATIAAKAAELNV